MARNDVVNRDGSINYDTIGGFKDRLDGHDSSLASSTQDLVAKGFNVKYPFGTSLTPAKGDGITDDAPAIQAMINYLNSNGGGIIYLPKGVYILKSKLVWMSNVSLVGAGVGLSILQPYEQTGTTAGFTAIGWDGVTQTYNNPMVNCLFKDFEIDGSMMTINSYSSVPKGIDIHFMKNCTFKDLYIHDTCATGLGADFLRNVVIDNVTTYNCGRSWVSTGTEQNAGGAGIGIGTKRLNNESVIIKNCVADGNGNYGIFFEDQTAAAVPSASQDAVYIVSNCIAKNGRNHGIGTKGGDRVIISNNVCYNNASAGIFVLDNLGTVLTDCEITNNITTKNKDGILLNTQAAINHLKIHGNDVSKNTDVGILATGGLTGLIDVIIEHNSIYENLAGIGITGVAHSEFVKIKNNNVMGNQQNGISLVGTSIDSTTISDNEIYNNNTSNGSTIGQTSGIHIDLTAKNLTIKNNRCGNTSSTALYQKNQKYGLEITGASSLTDCHIERNRIFGNLTANTSFSSTSFVGDTSVNDILTSPANTGDYTQGALAYGTQITDINLNIPLICKEQFWYTLSNAKVIDETQTTSADQVTGNVIFNPTTKLYRQWNGTVWVNAHIVNAISDGNFASGTSGWSTYSVTGFTASNNIASFTATASGGNIYQAPSGGSVVGRIYYAVAQVLSSSTNVVLGFGGTTAASAGTGAFTKISVRMTATGTGHAISIKDNNASGWAQVQVKQAMVVDLTAMYGAGNEPTQAWCDANIPFRP